MLKRHIPSLLSVGFILIVWQLISLSIGYPAIFPPLNQLLAESSDLLLRREFYNSLGVTVLRGFIGFVLSFIIALLAGSIAAHSRFWKHFFNPIVVVIRSVPVISVVLIALLWFSPPQLPVFIALLTMLPVLYQSVLSGFEHVDRKLIEMSTVFGYSRWKTFLKIHLPSAKMLILSGVRTAAGFGWRAIIIGEVLAQPLHGIGSAMKMAQVYLNVSELFAWTLMAVLVSYLFDNLIQLLAKIRFSTFSISSENQLLHTDKNASIKKITVSNLFKSFGNTTLFENLNFQFSSEKVFLLKAPSGRGKTSYLRLLAGIIKPDSGKIAIENCKSVAYSFQDCRLCNWLTVSENIKFAIPNQHKFKEMTDNFINEIVAALELSDEMNKLPYQLSGGQQQRVALARALAAKPDLLLLDEPLNGLDNELKMKIMNFIDEYILRYKVLVVWATHEEIRLPHAKIEVVML